MRLLALGLVSAALLVGCSLFGDDEDAPDLGRLSLEVDAVDDGVLFRLRTVEDYPCLGYRLVTRLRIESDLVEAVVEGVEEPDGACATALGPATYTTTLPLTDGTYTLRIEVGDEADRLLLQVDGALLTLSPIETTFVEPYAPPVP